jgi:hypothetical protein
VIVNDALAALEAELAPARTVGVLRGGRVRHVGFCNRPGLSILVLFAWSIPPRSCFCPQSARAALNLVHACSEELHRTFPQGARLGVLATRTTYHTELYRRGLVDFQIEYPAEYDQELLMVGIASTKSGEINKARSCIEKVAFRLLDKGCDAVVMAYREIPLALAKLSSRDP